MINLLETEPEYIRFIVEFNTLYAREGTPARVRQTYSIGSEIIIIFIQQGIADGSIRPDLDANFLAAAIFNLVSRNEQPLCIAKQTNQ